MAGYSQCGCTICETTEAVNSDLAEDTLSVSDNAEALRVEKGWFYNCKAGTGAHTIIGMVKLSVLIKEQLKVTHSTQNDDTEKWLCSH